MVLPQELIERILDFLHPDKHALHACALTHPAFLPRSRHHLFHSVSVPKPPSSSADRLVAVLTATPAIGALIRELRVQAGNFFLLRFLIQHHPCPNLHTLAIACGNVVELAQAGHLVQAARGSLVRLYFGSTLNARTLTAFVPLIGRSGAGPPQLDALSRLELGLGRTKTFGQPDSELQIMLPLLMDVVSLPRLQTLILAFLDPIWTMVEVYIMPWSSLDASAGPSQFFALRELRIVFNTELSPCDMWREVTRLMPYLHSRGIISLAARKYGRYLLARNSANLEVLNAAEEATIMEKWDAY